MTQPTTIEDVASAAGVSVATVSRALRDLPNVAPATRARVQEVARRLRYRADPSAAALAAGRTKTIAMAVPLLGSWYFNEVMAGAHAVLRDAGYDLLLFTVDGDISRQRLLSGPLVKRADGLLLVDVHVPEDEAAALVADQSEPRPGRQSRAMSVVTVGIELPGATSVTVDDRRLARDAVSHLLELGHTEIGVIHGGEDDPSGFRVPAERQQGYLDALAAAGLAPRPELSVAGNFSVSGGADAMGRLLDLDRAPTAVFAMSDEMAFGALREIARRDLRVPEDMSVVGVDDHDFAAVVGLTTVHQEVAEHGAVAARLLLDQLTGVLDQPVHHTARTELVVRRSTGRPRTG